MEQILADLHFAQNLRGSRSETESRAVASTIASLNLQKHPEGGYYAETDRASLLIPNPFKISDGSTGPNADKDSVRNASTTIFYLLTPKSPVGHFHRNKARTVHTLHSGRGRYVLIHEDGQVETFIVGHDLARGEKLQWIVDGGKYKASYLLPDKGAEESEGGLLISETVVPGFEFSDHDFLTANGLWKFYLFEGRRAVTKEESRKQLGWLLNEGERKKLELMK
jgi:predicted cupin superfamily sugar epimerase